MRPDLHKGVPFTVSAGNFHYARGRAQRCPGEIKASKIEREPHYAERGDFRAPRSRQFPRSA